MSQNKDKLYSYNKLVADSLEVDSIKLTIESINGPDWTDPTGDATIVIQFNVSLGESRLMWWDGNQWNFALNNGEIIT